MPSGHLASRRAKRSDTFIATAVLVALIAGWIFNFISVKELTLRLDSLVAASTRWS